MNIRKLIAGVVCLAAASGFLTGCGSASSTADNEEKVTVWAWDETFNIKAVNEAKKIYEMVISNRKQVLTDNSCAFLVLESGYREYVDRYLKEL